MSSSSRRAASELFDPAKLQALRKERGMTKQVLAATVDVTYRTLGAWESGVRSPYPHNLGSLAIVFQVDVEELLTVARADWTLTQLRIASGWEQQWAAKELGVSVERLRYIESGTNPLDPDLADALAELYHTPVAEVDACWARARLALLQEPEPAVPN
jgi:transcriptional regulator with XRE-family HTH domain